MVGAIEIPKLLCLDGVDFALVGLIDIVNQSGARLAGCGIAIEKGYQGGGDKLREQGIRVESMAIVDSMNDETGEIVFRK